MRKLFMTLNICAYGIFILCAYSIFKIGRDSEVFLPLITILCMIVGIVFLLVALFDKYLEKKE